LALGRVYQHFALEFLPRYLSTGQFRGVQPGYAQSIPMLWEGLAPRPMSPWLVAQV
jgi:hypothetical protein